MRSFHRLRSLLKPLPKSEKSEHVLAAKAAKKGYHDDDKKMYNNNQNDKFEKKTSNVGGSSVL